MRSQTVHPESVSKPLLERHHARVMAALDRFTIELPSWGFAQTGTRFGKYLDPTAAATLHEKLADAAEVHRVTGCCPTVAVHVLWDFAADLSDVAEALHHADRLGVQIGSINPNLFEDQRYRFGSIAASDAGVRRTATDHLRTSIELAKRTGSRDISVWLADGSNYPGSADIRRRRRYLTEALQEAHRHLNADQRLLIEYKPFEPAFYHTDLADWGMALLTAQAVGPQAHVLVDTGHHYQGQNIEQIVAWLLSEGRLGGFHFNDRRYADDDLTLGSIDPYQVFRIFLEILRFEFEEQALPHLAYMVDQSHNLKTKLEAMVQTVTMAQMLFARAALVDLEELAAYQRENRIIDAEELLRGAFFADATPLLEEWRAQRNLSTDPLGALRTDGYLENIRAARAERNTRGGSRYA